MERRQITIDDIATRYRPLAEMLTLDGFLQLVQAHGGSALYIPKDDAIIKNLRDEEICAAFDAGTPIRELARKYNLSDRQIRKIIAPIFKRVRTRPVIGQIGFDLQEGDLYDTLCVGDDAFSD
ncbi:hypothetical protein LJC27_01920 [Christensenellaceae bacterium OttesenSCG-928-M15]|nr:hypothetical protein [Christensenellaceae bacterium OttesenSCG-928-M15]